MERHARHVDVGRLGQNRLGQRALQRQHRGAIRDIGQLDIEAGHVVEHPGEILLDVRCVDDHHIGIGQMVDEDIIHNPAVGPAQQRVVRLALVNRRDILGGDVLKERQRGAALDFDLAHVADIEQAGGVANRVVLVHDPAILDWHLPATELDHPRAQGDVAIVERRSFELRRGCQWRASFCFTDKNATFRFACGSGIIPDCVAGSPACGTHARRMRILSTISHAQS